MVERLVISNYQGINDLVRQTAFKYWRKSWRVSNYVFASIDDVMQVCWVRLLESKKGRELITQDIEGFQGLICTIAKRGIQDYVRSHLGREGKSSKNDRIFTTYYMDYLESDSGDIVDLPIASATRSIEDELIKKQMLSELNDFMNRKLSRRDKMIMDYLYKNDATAKEVGEKMFNITESRVSQIRTQAIKQLRNKFSGDFK